MITVLLTDDHELVRTGIRRLLEDSKQVSIVGEADCGEKSIQLAQEHQPDVILMDVNMPGIGGVEACRRILQRNPKQKIIVLSVHNEQTFPKRLLEIGARGYLTKECGVDEMIKAIKHAKSKIQSLLAGKLQSKFCPVLHFYMDENFKKTLETMNLIDKVIRETENKGSANQT